ncbi:MAG: regulatory protein RecX [Treponema sp.]|nr:regulatory protein RecX [Treponema sp.]
MIISSINPTSYAGMYKVIPTEGTSFFVRPEYLPGINFDLIDKDVEYNDSQTEIFLDAGLACVVELKAVAYLARCEQSRFGLNRKLTEKGFEKKYIMMALDLLESKNYLSDFRFSTAWLHSRKINHYEGRSRLLSELMSRGISKEISNQALDEFFEENDEMEICKKACEKLVKKGKKDEKLIAAMMQAGFSYKMIKLVLEK